VLITVIILYEISNQQVLEDLHNENHSATMRNEKFSQIGN